LGNLKISNGSLNWGISSLNGCCSHPFLSSRLLTRWFSRSNRKTKQARLWVCEEKVWNGFGEEKETLLWEREFMSLWIGSLKWIWRRERSSVLRERTWNTISYWLVKHGSPLVFDTLERHQHSMFLEYWKLVSALGSLQLHNGEFEFQIQH